MKLARFCLSAFALMASQIAEAGPQYLDDSGYAASGFDVVAFFGIGQAGAGERQPAPLRGTTLFTASHNGARWAFISAANRDLFLADPEAFAPQYDGHSAFAAANGGKVPGNPQFWRIVDGKLYFNTNWSANDLWENDISRFIAMADAEWQKLESHPASDLAVIEFVGETGPIRSVAADPEAGRGEPPPPAVRIPTIMPAPESRPAEPSKPVAVRSPAPDEGPSVLPLGAATGEPIEVPLPIQIRPEGQ